MTNNKKNVITHSTIINLCSCLEWEKKKKQMEHAEYILEWSLYTPETCDSLRERQI
jgi:hypothetical protein